jgi:alanine racemase
MDNGSNGKTIVKEWLNLLSPDYNIIRSPKSYNSQIGAAILLLQSTSNTIWDFEAGISTVSEMEKLEQLSSQPLEF